MVVGHALRAIGRVAKGFYVRRSSPVPCSTVMITDHYSRPVDCDFFGHMNNAFYFRHAELARWELLPRTGILQQAVKHKWMFLVVSQDADYLKPLPPLSTFSVVTKATKCEADKYLFFRHDFISPDGSMTYCTANVRAIVKHMRGHLRGKTVRPSEMDDMTDEEWLTI